MARRRILSENDCGHLAERVLSACDIISLVAMAVPGIGMMFAFDLI